MLLIDFSQTGCANVFAQMSSLNEANRFLGKDKEIQLNPDLLRHMILNSIRKLTSKFKDYGFVVICTDNNNYWRKSYFRYYKANRKKERDASVIDWQLVFKILHDVRDELKENFPYKVMNVSMAEADDIIAVLSKRFYSQDPIMICSGDHDFGQLQIYNGVQQYSSVQDKFLPVEDPVRALKEHIIRGDKRDGVPNFLSSDDSLVTGTRQKTIREAKLEMWLTQDPTEFCDDEQTLKNYQRNKKLVDFSEIPSQIEANILEEFDKPVIGSKRKILPYLMKHRLKELIESVGDF